MLRINICPQQSRSDCQASLYPCNRNTNAGLTEKPHFASLPITSERKVKNIQTAGVGALMENKQSVQGQTDSNKFSLPTLPLLYLVFSCPRLSPKCGSPANGKITWSCPP
jgi:hypothetical protein